MSAIIIQIVGRCLASGELSFAIGHPLAHRMYRARIRPAPVVKHPARTLRYAIRINRAVNHLPTSRYRFRCNWSNSSCPDSSKCLRAFVEALPRETSSVDQSHSGSEQASTSNVSALMRVTLHPHRPPCSPGNYAPSDTATTSPRPSENHTSGSRPTQHDLRSCHHHEAR